jgi:hypothetical protein
MINCSIDCSLTFKHYVFEASFWLKDWQLSNAVRVNGAIRILHVGPFCLCITNLKTLHESQFDRISLDELLDL